MGLLIDIVKPSPVHKLKVNEAKGRKESLRDSDQVSRFGRSQIPAVPQVAARDAHKQPCRSKQMTSVGTWRSSCGQVEVEYEESRSGFTITGIGSQPNPKIHSCNYNSFKQVDSMHIITLSPSCAVRMVL
eukprot:239539-Amphidinium_carterae.2